MKSANFIFLEPSGPLQARNGIALTFTLGKDMILYNYFTEKFHASKLDAKLFLILGGVNNGQWKHKE